MASKIPDPEEHDRQIAGIIRRARSHRIRTHEALRRRDE